MATDNRTNEPTDKQVWAAAHAVAKLRKEQTGAPAWFNIEHARAALVAAAGLPGRSRTNEKQLYSGMGDAAAASIQPEHARNHDTRESPGS